MNVIKNLLIPGLLTLGLAGSALAAIDEESAKAMANATTASSAMPSTKPRKARRTRKSPPSSRAKPMPKTRS